MTAQPSATPPPQPTLDEFVAKAMQNPEYAAWIAGIKARMDAAPPTDFETLFASLDTAMASIPAEEREAWANEGEVDEVLVREIASTHE